MNTLLHLERLLVQITSDQERIKQGTSVAFHYISTKYQKFIFHQPVIYQDLAKHKLLTEEELKLALMEAKLLL